MGQGSMTPPMKRILAASASSAPAETTGAASSIATQRGSVSQSAYEEDSTS